MIAKKIILSLSALLVVLLLPLATFAQTPAAGSFDVTVSPTFVELSAKPGSTVSQVLKLRNNTNNLITVIPEVKIMGGDERGELTIKETTEEYLDWLTIEDEKVTLKPHEWTDVKFTIEIPEEAAYGYYWAVTFTADTSDVKTQTGATLSASVAVPILLTVTKEGAKTEGKLLDFKTDSFYYEYPPVEFTTVFQNNGNVHIRPQGNVFIKDFLGRDVQTLTINDSQGSILPGLNRSFKTEWNDGFITYEHKKQNGQDVIDDKGRPILEMKIHFQKLLDLRIGKYTATALVLVSGVDRDYTYEKSISFFIFPWKVVLVIIAIVIFVGIGLFTTGRSIIRKVRRFFSKE